MKMKYHTIRKTSYDTLWHAVYTADGKDTWDRIPEGEALRLARELPPHIPEKRPIRIAGHMHAHGPVPQRPDAPHLGCFTQEVAGYFTLPKRDEAVDRLVLPPGCADHLNVK